MIDSILDSIKKRLGPSCEQEDFDPDIIDCINTAFSILHNVGIGPIDGFSITGNSEEWSVYTDDPIVLGMVKTYVYLKAKLFFDPPSNSFLLDSMKEELKELEWRLNVNSDS